MKLLSLIALAGLLAGCAGPEYFYCKGKGSWTFTAGAMVYSGTATLTSTCDDGGAVFYKGAKPPEVPSTAVAPVVK